MMFQKLTICLFLLLGSQASNAETGTELLQAFLQKTTTMQASFRQELHDNHGFLLQESAGQFSLQRPGKFIWDYVLPYEQKIISNGNKIWIYDSELEQVSVKKYDQVLTGAPILLLDKQKPLSEDFSVFELGKQGELFWVSLKPKTAENDFQQIKIAMAGKQLDTMKLIDNFDQTTTLVFTDLKTNLKLANDLFEFVPPSGTDIVGDF
ncbi:MAG: outer membrane lipoprotein chaperone LolA [Gammaproteobacteria bacterium]|nr:outer membrane lipoprotein chaperone LolA [Gammaproteobacteria bacterium]